MRMKINFGFAAAMGLIFVMLSPYVGQSNGDRITMADKNFKNSAAELTLTSDKMPEEVVAVKTDVKSPALFLPVKSWEFEPVVDGVEVIHDFVVQNKGTAPLNIERVKTG
jgi:hypothetical protein